MRILHLIGAYAPAEVPTGPPQQLHRLARALRACGADVRVVWRQIGREAASASLIHVTGVFSWVNLASASAARKRGVPTLQAAAMTLSRVLGRPEGDILKALATQVRAEAAAGRDFATALNRAKANIAANVRSGLA